jgi:hypothetical protein
MHQREFLLRLATAAALAALSSRLVIAECSSAAPPVPAAPASLWSELVPAGVISDASNYDGNHLSDSLYPQISAVDIENGTLFASYWSGFQIWDVSGGNATAPVRLAQIEGWNNHDCRNPPLVFPSWPGCGEFDAYVWAIDAPTGNDSLVAVGGEDPVGLVLFNTTNKTAPRLTYQDPFHSIHQVYAATINGRAYAFAADYGSGIFVYDMTAAQGLTRCLDNALHTQCPGVFKGKFGGGSMYLHGLQVGAQSLVVTGTGVGFGVPKDVELWNVSDPASPTKLGAAFGGSTPDGVALFSQGGQTYVGVRLLTSLAILNVSSCVSTACGSLPAPTAIVSGLREVPESNNWRPVIASTSGSTPFLYVGHHDLCHSSPEPSGKEEYLFDVSNPASPREVTPPQTIVDSGAVVDYWSWYYSDATRTHGWTAALGGKFNGPYFYRAARTLSIYPGDPVDFTDTSSGVVTGRTWTFPNGTPDPPAAPPPPR